MQIFGVDFTSAPRRAKPITCAACRLEGATLHVDALVAFDSFEVFENFLGQTGPWLAGLDFPFGQPRDLVAALDWPQRWASYVEAVSALAMGDFEALLRDYREARPPGRKHALRAVDRIAASRSPMTLYRTPVGRMFFHGAPRLLRAGVSVLPCHPGDPDRVALEAYPALVARKLIGRRSYKSDTRAQQTPERAFARRDLVEEMLGPRLASLYGLGLDISPVMAEELIEEPGADQLDAVLCAVQAAWACQRRRTRFGIPEHVNRDEGWIVDPLTAAA
ncbi:MAG: DUF429 domain-containing protein [Ectothiorhodospiraceae bacterium]|nr:DUF429 domain-containing protein [Chromatiales bacterium]MCP5154642.1 DUF429 domain-containing protein [Ectothiorhodospiraceae bacterium]